MIGELHVLPVLNMTDRADLGLDPAFDLRTSLAAPGAFAVRRPYPGGAIAGVHGAVNGFIVPIFENDERQGAVIECRWRHGLNFVRHLIEFDLRAASHVDRPVWTMDASFWRLAGDARALLERDFHRRMAVSSFSSEPVPDDHRRHLDLSYEDGAFVMRERLTLFPLPRRLMEAEATRRAAIKGASA